SKSIPHIAFLRLLPADVERPSGKAGHELERVVDGDPAATADVIDGSRRAPVASGAAGGDDIGDKCEVPGLISVAIQADGLRREGRTDELVKGHVGTLARAVDREKPQ